MKSVGKPDAFLVWTCSELPAGFSTSGENAQENDLIVIRGAGAAAKFDAHFERMWNAAQPMDEFEPAIRALELK